MQQCKPFGSTPLATHLFEIGERIALMEAKMRKKGLEAVLIVAKRVENGKAWRNLDGIFMAVSSGRVGR